MSARFALVLFLSFAAGGVLMAALGGATGVFDRGPTEQDVSQAAARGRDDAEIEKDRGKDTELAERRQRGYERGREAAEWLFLDRMPNPDSWFAGVIAGRARLLEMAEEAYHAGVADGERAGIDEALGAQRVSRNDAPAALRESSTSN